MRQKKGKNIYVHPIILDELDAIGHENGLETNIERMMRLAHYSRMGREIDRFVKLDFSRKMPQPPIEAYEFKPRKRKKTGGVLF